MTRTSLKRSSRTRTTDPKLKADLLCALLLLPLGLTAQEARLTLSLAADPQQSGPAALVFFRQECLGRLAHWPKGLSPWQALQVQVELPYRLRVSSSKQGLGQHSYFQARLEIPELGILFGHCDVNGNEAWHGRGLQWQGGRLAFLAKMAGIDHHGVVSLDIAAYIGQLLAGSSCQDPLGFLLTAGAAECGDLQLYMPPPINPNPEQQTEEWEIMTVGPSACGILLPAILALVADHQSRPQSGSLLHGDSPSELQRWISVARCNRNAQRAQAARQLGCLPDPAAVDCLERLLLTQDETRLAAMQALILMSSSSSLPQVLAAASPDIPFTEELAQWISNSMQAKQRPQPTAQVAGGFNLRPLWWTVLLASFITLLWQLRKGAWLPASPTT